MTEGVHFLLVVVISSVLITIDASCIDRKVKVDNFTESIGDELSKIFMEMGSNLKSLIIENTKSSKMIEDTKFEDDLCNTNIESKGIDAPKAAVEDRDDETEIEPQVTTEMGTTMISVDNHALSNVLVGPEICKKHEEFIAGECREVFEF